MIIIVPHLRTKDQAIALIAGSDNLFAGAAGSSVEIVDQRMEWSGSTMEFSFTGRLGFISVPLSGTLEVDEVNVTVMSELPPKVKSFLGEAKVASSIEKQLRRLL